MTTRDYYLHDGYGRSGDVVIREIVTQIRAILTDNRLPEVIKIGRDSFRTMVGHIQECGVMPPAKWPPNEENASFWNTPIAVQDEGFGIVVEAQPREPQK